MIFELNTFHNITKAPSQIFPLIRILLKSFPLTKACIDTLQDDLFQNIQYGFFSPQSKLISQGETGNDLFLICTHKVDVIVNGELVLQMPAPELFGDKSLVAKKAVRSATVSIAREGTCFVLKLPIGMFIQNFKDPNIPDQAFSREAQIYHKIFQIIQKRLFKYIHLQKQIWEEVSSTLDLLNHQLILNGIAAQKEKKWNAQVSQAIKDHLLSDFKSNWPRNLDVTNTTIRQVLKLLLEKQFPKNSGHPVTHRQKVWKKWLNAITTIILKTLPKEELPVNIGEIEMFNPKNYQLRIQKFLSGIEKQLKVKLLMADDEDYSQLKFNNFFHSSIDANVFELQDYLETLLDIFPVTSPNRIIANVSQQIANITAEAENEFNRSISRMHHFLKKAYQLVTPKKEMPLPDSFITLLRKKYLPLIINAIKADKETYLDFARTLNKNLPLQIDALSSFSDLLKASSSRTIQQDLQQAFMQIIKAFQLTIPGFGKGDLFHTFHLIEIPARRIIAGENLKDYILIPLTENLAVNDGVHTYNAFSRGTLISASFLSARHQTKETSPTEDWNLTCLDTTSGSPHEKSAVVLLFQVPKSQVKNKEKTSEAKNTHMFQWIIECYLKQIHECYQNSTQIHKKLIKVIEAEYLERQVQQFEEDQKPLKIYQYGLLLDAVQDLTGIKLPFKTTISPAIFSKQLYNAVVTRINRENPNLKLEDRGNKAYTLWRYVQSRLVSERPLEKRPQKDQLENPRRLLIYLKRDLADLLSRYKILPDKNILSIGEQKSHVHLDQILIKFQSDQKNFPQVQSQIIDIIAIYFREFYKETYTLKSRIEEIGPSGKTLNAGDVQINYIKTIIDKIQKILLKTSG